MPGADWLVGKIVRMPEGPAAWREKVCESMETFAFLSILPTDLYFLQFVSWFGQIVPGPKIYPVRP